MFQNINRICVKNENLLHLNIICIVLLHYTYSLQRLKKDKSRLTPAWVKSKVKKEYKYKTNFLKRLKINNVKINSNNAAYQHTIQAIWNLITVCWTTKKERSKYLVLVLGVRKNITVIESYTTWIPLKVMSRKLVFMLKENS